MYKEVKNNKFYDDFNLCVLKVICFLIGVLKGFLLIYIRFRGFFFLVIILIFEIFISLYFLSI